MSGRIHTDPAHAAGMRDLYRTVRIRLRRQATNLAHDFSHVERVRHNASRVAENLTRDEGIDLDGDVINAACLLHEIGRGAERRGESDVDATLRVGEEMLRHDSLGDLVYPVLQALVEHLTPGREPSSPEARVLRDADLLEELGAIGLARTLASGFGDATPLLYDADDPLAQNRPLDEGTHVLDRLPAKISLPERFTTAWGRTEAKRRARVLAAYYKAFFREAGHA